MSKLWDSFKECVTFHMFTVFLNDPAETKRYYISNCLKKPDWVPIRQFMQCMMQLNDYLEPLPCLYQNNQATWTMKKVGPIDDANLVGYFLLCALGLSRPNMNSGQTRHHNLQYD